MKVGSRVTAMLLLAVIPVIFLYTYWNISRSRGTFINDLKREIRATARGLAPSVANDLRDREWSQIGDVFQRISADGTSAALLNPEGRLRFALPDFPAPLVPDFGDLKALRASGFDEFERTAGGRRWFVRVAPLNASGDSRDGYLLVAQDWTDITEDFKLHTAASMIAALLLVGLIVAIIHFVVRRYVSVPLAKLSGKVMHFAEDQESARTIERDEVILLSEEFRRLDEQLSRARIDLLNKHRRELELERRLQHADRLATIGTLASGLAHEIGTPMGVIRTRAEFLLKSGSGPSRNVEIIISQIDRISRIVRMLLEYARPRESRMIACDIRQVVRTALGLIEMEAVRRNVQVIDQQGPDALMVSCDPDQLQQVFVNLAVNALDAMAVCGGVLRVTAQVDHDQVHHDQAAPQVKILFEDSGSGVAVRDRAHIFDPFFTTKEPGKGTGMGLAVSQSIVRDHGGEIDFDAAPGRTQFAVTLPFAPESAGTSAIGVA
ncbi:MAG: hypothetical protein IVW54_17165 [Candidatus Binataceae bacterium]|nr:hypothetical protein [Candidatus Binataceae bacterium]